MVVKQPSLTLMQLGVIQTACGVVLGIYNCIFDFPVSKSAVRAIDPKL
ncbi:hypothetical protein LMG8526HA_02356 [Lactococcus lactis]|nr:hypothetical protein [Lactococcus lactis]